MPKQFQSNTIVPNKSTMVEEDDDAISPTSPDPNALYGMQRAAGQIEVCFLLLAPLSIDH